MAEGEIKITGRIEQMTAWKPEYNSVGLKVAGQWYNIYGTQEEVGEKLKDVKRGDNVEISIPSGKRYITAIKKVEQTSTASPLTATAEEKTLKATEAADLAKINRLMKQCFELALPIVKEYAGDDGFVPPEVLAKVAVAMFITATRR